MRGKKSSNKSLFVVLCSMVIVLTLTIGFAAYSRNVEISNIGANVNPNEVDLEVIFDNDQDASNELSVVKGVGEGADPIETGAIITNPTVSGVAPVISGFTSKFTEKGQSVEYTFYVHNDSSYTAFLESAEFTVATGTHKTCVAVSTGTTNSTTIQNACEDITLSVIVDDKTILSTGASAFLSHSIPVNGFKEIKVRIAYDGATYPLPDGDMRVTFDGIRLLYTTIEQ